MCSLKTRVREDKLLLDFFSKVVKKSLTEKERMILLFLSRRGNGLTVSKMVRKLSKSMDCSRSALWNNINELKDFHLLESDFGKPVRLTDLGVLVKGLVVSNHLKQKGGRD